MFIVHIRCYANRRVIQTYIKGTVQTQINSVQTISSFLGLSKPFSTGNCFFVLFDDSHSCFHSEIYGAPFVTSQILLTELYSVDRIVFCPQSCPTELYSVRQNTILSDRIHFCQTEYNSVTIVFCRTELYSVDRIQLCRSIFH